jgi:hypothetical protein
MSLFQYIIIDIGLAVILYGIVAGVLALRAILTHRDEEYRAKYEEFLLQKRRVEERLKRDRESMTPRLQ